VNEHARVAQELAEDPGCEKAAAKIFEDLDQADPQGVM
jgi:hypothetical protein